MEIKHVLGISGGKDSAALAIYMSKKFPSLNIDYYTCDTGRELKETYDLIDRLNSVLGKEIELYNSADMENSPEEYAFDHFLTMYGGYLPSPQARWCTKQMKILPFEREIGDAPTISYVGIRGDENREGHISNKENLQTIFPFRRNIWSEDVVTKALANSNIEQMTNYYKELATPVVYSALKDYITKPVSIKFTQTQKLEALLDADVKLFNKAIFNFLKTTDYPVGKLDYFPLVEDDTITTIDGVFKLLEESGVGIPAYYLPIEYTVEINGEVKKGTYARSRSGCFFCFYQQKIEWVWLLEQHPNLFQKAMEYEKEGYTWMSETLADLAKPERVQAIKKDHYLRTHRVSANAVLTDDWKDSIIEAEGEGCASCFI